MGASADDRKTRQTTAAFLAANGKRASGERHIDAIRDDAEGEAQREHMPLSDAMKIRQGLTRLPYGTPRK